MIGRRRRTYPRAHGRETDAEINEVLADLEGAENYKAWLLELIGPHVRGDVLEVGAGRGTYSRELRALGSSLTAVEPSGQGAPLVRERVAGLTGVTVVEGTTAEVTGEFDSAVMLNVLEHIDDDDAVLLQLHDRLRRGGRLCIWVPAFPVLFGAFDRSIGHHRRYRLRQLTEQAHRAGFEIVDHRYANLPGFFAWFVVVRLLGWSPTTGGLASVYDRALVPAIRAVERRVRPPFGQSLLVVARKPSVW